MNRLPPPSIDRHVHLEGSLDPAWVRQRAQVSGVPVPGSFESLQRGEPQPFEGFIEAFLFSSRFLEDADAVREALRAAVRRLPAAEGRPMGLDLWVSPLSLVKHLARLSLDSLWRGLDDGIAEARSQGVSVAVVLDAVNHFGPADGQELLDLVLPGCPAWVVGFSTGGLERVPFREWAPVFARARTAGLRLAAHAGENGPGSNVREALLEADVERIVHGVRAASDPALLELLAERRTAVDVCLASNRALVPDLGEHPLRAMLRAGVRCALGTDDPGVIPATLAGEWKGALALGLSKAEGAVLGRNALEDAWCLAPGTVVPEGRVPRHSPSSSNQGSITGA